MNEQWKNVINTKTKENKVMVFMRGTPEAPKCGFSARVVRVLQEVSLPFSSMDMDSDRDLWQTLKEVNQWPTSPQIYIDGEFIGGCDILMEMYRSGELAKIAHP
jgi:monothiol glutaredoxin